MSKNIGIVNTSLSFATLFTQANTLCSVLANEIVTANSSAGGGATTTGNGFVIGIFGANTIVGNTIQGGNVVTANVLYLGSNVNVNANYIVGTSLSINATHISVGNVSTTTSATEWGNTSVNTTINSVSFMMTAASSNAVINASGFFYDGIALGTQAAINITTTGGAAQNIDSFLISTWRSAVYALSVTDNNANNYQMSKVHVLQSGGAAYATEYGILTSNTAMGNFTATVNSTAAILQFTPVSSNTTVKGVRMATIAV